MLLSEPTIIKMDGIDTSLVAGLRELCIGHDMLRSETFVSPRLKPIIAPIYSAGRFLLRSLGMGLADATSMHKHYYDPRFIHLSKVAIKAAEIAANSKLTLVTALTHKSKRGEFSSWHNGYYSPYIYNDDADVLSLWIPLQNISKETGSGFRFWFGGNIETKMKDLCSRRWKEMDEKPRGVPNDIVNPGKELRAMYKVANDTDQDSDEHRRTYYANLGEAILFNEYWPHTTTKWLMKDTRLSIVLRFVKAGTGLNAARLQKRKQALKLDGDEWVQYCTHISKITG